MDLFGEVFIAETNSSLGASLEKGESLWSDIEIVFGLCERQSLCLADIVEIDWTSQNGEFSSGILGYEVIACFLFREELLPDLDNF